jgi:nitrate reductase gamma subunit
MAQLQHLHWLPVIGAAIVAWLFSAVYYSVFCRAWAAAQGKTFDALKAENADRSAATKAGPFILSFIAEIVMAAAISGILFHIGIYGLGAGLFSGFMIWMGFVLTTIVVNNAFTFRSAKLTAIDAGHWFGVLLIIGGILGWTGR